MTEQQEAPKTLRPRQAGETPFGPGPFMDDLHRTPTVLWVAVALMCLGFSLIGGAVVALSMDTAAAIALFASGAAIGLIGLVLGARNRIMSNVD